MAASQDNYRDIESDSRIQTARNVIESLLIWSEVAGLGVSTVLGILVLQQVITLILPASALIYGLLSIGEGFTVAKGAVHPDDSCWSYVPPYQYSSTERNVRGLFQALTGFAVAEGAAEMLKGVDYTLTFPSHLNVCTPLSGLYLRMALHFVAKLAFDLRDLQLLWKNWEAEGANYKNNKQQLQKLVVNILSNLAATIAFTSLAMNPVGLFGYIALGVFATARAYQHKVRPVLFWNSLGGADPNNITRHDYERLKRHVPGVAPASSM